MKLIAIDKHNGRLKIFRVEMPNAPYLNRCKKCCATLLLFEISDCRLSQSPTKCMAVIRVVLSLNIYKSSFCFIH